MPRRFAPGGDVTMSALTQEAFEQVGAWVAHVGPEVEREVCQARDSFATVAAIEDAAAYYTEVDRRALRVEEVEKLNCFGCFVPTRVADLPAGAFVFKHLWVDTPENRA